MYIAYISVLFTVQLTCTLAILPLKCILQDNPLLDIFTRSNIPDSFYDVYKISPLRFDPFKLDSVHVDQDGLLLDIKDIEYSGLKDAIVDEFGLHLSSNLTRIYFHSDLWAKGLYKVEGSLFSIPISGEGSLTAFFKNVKIDMIMPFDITHDENGKRYIELKRFYYWQDISDDGKFNFANLYNGNEEQSDSMHALINSNWRFITKQFGKPFMDKIVGHIFNVFRNYLLSLPLKDLDKC